MNKPKYIFRIDDGFRFTLQDNGKYTMDRSKMNPKYEYDLQALSNVYFTTDKTKILYSKIKWDNYGCKNRDFDE